MTMDMQLSLHKNIAAAEGSQVQRPDIASEPA